MAYKLPNFLIAGAAKSGTSSLYYYLRGHPDIFLSPIKEPCYFSAQVLNFPQHGIGDIHKAYLHNFRAYSELFVGISDQAAIGEASTDTLYYSSAVIPIIKRLLGRPRIIIILRNPVDRAYSAYLHLVRDARESLSFEKGLQAENERIRQNWNAMWHYCTRGLYFKQVSDFIETFGRDKVLIILYDDLKRSSLYVVTRVCNFLEVDSNYQPQDVNFRFNASGIPWSGWLNRIFLMKNSLQLAIRGMGTRLLTDVGWVRFRDSVRSHLYRKSEISPETRLFLNQYFRQDLLRLQDLIQRDISFWLD